MKLRARENSYERVLEMATTTKTATKKTTAKTATAKPKAEPKVEVKEAKVEAKVEEKTTAKTFSEKEVQEMIARAVADAMAKANTSPSVIQVESKTEYVTLQYIGGIAEGTSVNLGALGQIYRDGDTITVPKQHFVSNINATVNLLLKNRELIVLEGLTDEERIRFGVSYKPNELLNGDTFARLLDYSADELGEDLFRPFRRPENKTFEKVCRRSFKAFLECSAKQREDLVFDLFAVVTGKFM